MEKEKRRLLKQDGFQILEYIRSSIEIIMNLKIEDLEKEMSLKNNNNNRNNNSNDPDMNSSGYSITSASFVHASMKEALANSQHGFNQDNNNKNKNTNTHNKVNNNTQQEPQSQAIEAAGSDEPPKEYEKML